MKCSATGALLAVLCLSLSSQTSHPFAPADAGTLILRTRTRTIENSALAAAAAAAASTDVVDDNTTRSSTTTSTAVVEFPPPLTPFQRATRAVEFYRRALPVLAAYKAKEIELEWKRKTSSVTKEEEEDAWNELDEWGSTRIAETIQEMKGFYVKTGQVISTRVDLFPEAYTSKLQKLQDGIEAMPFAIVKQVVEQELLDGAPLSELFATFDETPLGCASIAQVHKATLLDGRVVAVKLQRPNVEPKLRGDIANLKRISKVFRKSLPVDYYAVFCELGDALENELNFLAEAQAMKKIHLAISHNNENGKNGGDSAGEKAPPPPPPVTIPLPIGELVTKRVLVMDFVPGVPLNRLSEIMEEKGIIAGSPESRLAGRRILDSLAVAFGRMIFGAGFLHGDPHPGNIFIGEGGKVSLIDCGQFKSLSRARRLQFAKLVLAVDRYQKAINVASDDDTAQVSVATATAKKDLAECARGFGIECVDGRESEDDLACAIALVLFSDTGIELPGNYSSNELSEDSPIRLLTSFPQELILLGRATVLLKGIAKKLDVRLSLVDRWGEQCQTTLETAAKPSLPLWARGDTFVSGNAFIVPSDAVIILGGNPGSDSNGKIRFRQVAGLTKQWAKGKGKRLGKRVVERLPRKVRTSVLEYVLAREEKKSGN